MAFPLPAHTSVCDTDTSGISSSIRTPVPLDQIPPRWPHLTLITSWIPHLQIQAHWQVRSEWKLLSHVRLFATPRTIQSMEFSRPEYWSGYPFPWSRASLPAELSVKPKACCAAVHGVTKSQTQLSWTELNWRIRAPTWSEGWGT